MKTISILVSTLILLTNCASIPMESEEKTNMARQFNSPLGDKAGLYIYRSGVFGGALKKDIWVNGKCIGETAPNIFFYEEVQGGKEHKVSTESEFSPNDLSIKTDSGKNYFIQQFIKMGVFVGGAGLKIVDEATGKRTIQKLKMAKKGSCSK